MRRATLVTVATMTAVVMSTAGCTGTTGGQPSASGGPGTSTSAAGTTSGAGQAPKVADPRDARGVSPCSALTAQQLATLGLDAGKPREAALPPPLSAGCQYAAVGNEWGVLYGFDTGRSGLDEIYQRRSSYQHFEPRTIGGYPAVDAQTVFNADDCYSYVGVADTQVLLVNVDNRPSSGHALEPACERLDEIATMIIGNLPPLK